MILTFEFSANSRNRCVDDTTLQQRNTVCPETIEGNALHRAASTDETAAQRVERQQSVAALQLQTTDGSLAHITNGNNGASHSNRNPPKHDRPANAVLHGVGSQFAGSPDPASESRN